jgi:hypothetical protein
MEHEMSRQKAPDRRDEPVKPSPRKSATVDQTTAETPTDEKTEHMSAKDSIDDVEDIPPPDEDLERHEQSLLDEAIEETFPASDPISVPTHEEEIERHKRRK